MRLRGQYISRLKAITLSVFPMGNTKASGKNPGGNPLKSFKKSIRIIMKAYRFVLILFVLALSACSVKEINETTKTTERELTIEAYRADNGAETKTYLKESDGSVWWVPGDAISLFYGSGADGGSLFSSQATDTAKITNFTGTINVITGGAEISFENTFFWGLYPYSESASCDGAGVTMTLPSEQKAQGGTFATMTFPSIGRSQGLHMGFYNICGGMKFSVTKAGVKKVSLKSRNGESIAGTAKVSFDAEGLPVAEILDGSDEIVLKAPAGQDFEPGKYYYIVMFPGTLTGGFTVTLETLLEAATYEKEASITAKRSIFGKIPDIDADLNYTTKSGNIPIEDESFKQYLVENFDTDTDGEISYVEALSISRIDVCTDSIESVQGIEYMPALYFLRVNGSTSSSGKLTSLDVSENPKLASLHCDYNQLTSLDVSKNTALADLRFQGNLLTNLDVSNNTALDILDCGKNQMTSLDVSENICLKSLYCDSNLLTSLDVSNNTALRDLRCQNNYLADLNVSENVALTLLYCYSNQLTNLDVSNNTALQDLRCQSNFLESLDVSDNTLLETLDCAPMDDSQGNNLLAVLYVFQDQVIPYVTVDRGSSAIPDGTRILVRNTPKPVDLGLSVRWSPYNFGATRPEESVKYYAWGEVEPKGTYWWDTYKWGGRTVFTKYNTNSSNGIVDNRTELLEEDDVAHLYWGGDWRMPTYEEWTELRAFCTWTWTSNYEGTGVAGMIITGKKTGYTDSSFFLPATGRMQNGSIIYAGENGNYWSSSLDRSAPVYAWGVGFNSSENLEYDLGRRCLGLSVRPVTSSNSFVLTDIDLDKTEITLFEGQELYLHATNKSVTWMSGNPSVATVDSNGRVFAMEQGHTIITISTIDGRYSASCEVTVEQRAVDLGLSVKWASYNLGGATPEKYGNYYYAWGELSYKESYGWDTYKWCGGNSFTLSKYNTNEYYGIVDNNTELDLEDDVANVKWGGTWRIPTNEEWAELKNNCTWAWTSNYRGTGVAGMIVTSKKSGFTDKFIFLPAAGYWSGASRSRAGSAGFYWSSSLLSGDPSSVSSLYFIKTNVRENYSFERGYGLPVRPVCE